MQHIETSVLVEVVSMGMMDDGFHGVRVMTADEDEFTITMDAEEVKRIARAGLLGKKVRLSVSFPLEEST
jgi:hypothetical protein